MCTFEIGRPIDPDILSDAGAEADFFQEECLRDVALGVPMVLEDECETIDDTLAGEDSTIETQNNEYFEMKTYEN